MTIIDKLQKTLKPFTAQPKKAKRTKKSET
ncbi:MAG: hypothetical protein RL247_788, partial [Actinomycetota bacterium]